MIKKKDILAAAALALIVIILTGLVLDCSHDWGDDFAAYLLEGVALGNGTFDRQITLNYALHNRLDPRGDYGKTHVYVWGYPLLLSAVYRAAGYDTESFGSIVYYKIPGLLFLGILVFALYLLFRGRFGMPVSALLTVLFSTCTLITDYTNSILTEIVFLALCFLALVLSERMTEREDTKGKVAYGIPLGIVLWYACAVRLNGIVAVACVALQQILERFVYRREKLRGKDALLLLPFAVFGILRFVFDELVFRPATRGSSDFAGSLLASFGKNIRTYYLAVYEWLHDMLLHLNGGSRPASRLIVTAIVWTAILLFAAGVAADGFRRKNVYLTVFCLGSFIGTCFLSHNQWIRYIVPVLPVFLMYSALGLKRIAEWTAEKVKRRAGGEKIRPAVKRTLLRVLCLCAAVYAVFPLVRRVSAVGGKWGRHGLYAYSSDARKTYRYIQDNLPEDCVIQCNQYRALLLNTGRRTIHTAGDTGAADYYLHIEECSDAKGFDPESFREILRTDTTVLYERSDGKGL